MRERDVDGCAAKVDARIRREQSDVVRLVAMVRARVAKLLRVERDAQIERRRVSVFDMGSSSAPRLGGSRKGADHLEGVLPWARVGTPSRSSVRPVAPLTPANLQRVRGAIRP